MFTIIGLAGLTKLKLKIDDSSWLDNSDSLKIAEDRYKAIFGNEQYVAVLVKAKDVFDPEVLTAIDHLSKRLQNEVPFADTVTSLTSLSISKGTEEGIDVSNPFKKGIPGGGKPLSQMTDEEKASLAQKKAFMMGRSSLINNVVSDDCTETWVLLNLLPFKDKNADTYKVGYAALDIVQDPEFQKNSKFTMKGAGIPYTYAEEELVLDKETNIRVLSGFIVMLLCLILLVRSLRGVLIPVLVTVLGIGTVFGYSGWLGIVGDKDLLTLPILLSMALSIGYALHFINAFQLEFSTNTNRKETVISCIKTTGWPILFTVLTTVASFVSFMFSGIKSLKWLGGISSCAVLAVYLYVVVMLPVFYSFGKDGATKANHATEKEIKHQARQNALLARTDEMYGKLGTHVLKRRIPILIISAVIFIFSVVGLFKITVGEDYLNIYGPKVPFIARMIDVVHSKLGNQYSYNIMIEYPDADAFKDPEHMKALDACSEQVGKLRMTKVSGNKPRVASVTNIVKEMNRTLNGDDPAYYAIPDDPDLLSQILFLYEISGGKDLPEWVSDDYKSAHITVDLAFYQADKMLLDISDAQRIAEKCFPGAKVSLVGEILEMSRMNQKLVVAEIKSFIGSFIIIALMLIVAFVSIKTGLIDMIPNVAPVFLAGGLMGFLKYPLDMLLMTVMPMILGMAVDDTIHFTNHVKFGLENGKTYYEAIITTYREIGRSMASSTLILCIMFAMYMFSPINMLFRIGLLSIIGLGSALVADYTLTPILLYITKPLGKEKKNAGKSVSE